MGTTFSNNTAYTGGAIHNDSVVTITASQFLSNSATQNAGAIYNSGVATTAVYDYNATAQDFTHDWWVAVSGPSGAGLGSGNSVSPEVNFTPFLTTGYPQ
jgi:predicted outer membrane repeat protein